MSNESTVIAYIEARIASMENHPVASTHYYDLNNNDNVKNDFVFAVRPGSGNPVSGTVGSLTFEQEFEVELSRDYVESSKNDQAIRDAVKAMDDFAELLHPVLVNGRTIAQIILIKAPSWGSPQINHSQKSVSRIYTYQITYRKSLKGAA